MKQTVSGNIKCFDINCSDEDIEKSMNRKSILDTILEEKDKEIERLNNIINELHADLKTLWVVLWNMDTEMTGYQNEIFDKYYGEFHKEELKENVK